MRFPFSYCFKGKAKMIREHTKKQAIRIITSSANEYREKLEGRNFIFVYRDRDSNCIDFFEALFLPRNYQHLTGVDFVDGNGNLEKKPLLFYERCLRGRLAENDIRFRHDGTTRFKLEALPKIVNFISSSKMTGLYSGNKPLLAVDRLAGTTNFCLGFTRDGNYYAPSSCLLEDIRNLTIKPSQVLAVMSKKSDENVYKDIQYVAKGLPFDKLKLPNELGEIIDRSGYKEKH